MSSPRLTEVATLPWSTGECDIGPEIIVRPGDVRLRYDHEGDSGPEWTELTFGTGVALRVTPEVSVTEEMVDAYSRICEIRTSEWIASLRKEAGDKSLPADLRHFVVYFDGFGAVEVIARSVDIRTV